MPSPFELLCMGGHEGGRELLGVADDRGERRRNRSEK